MTESGIEQNALRLLDAFHELSGGKPREPVPLGGPDSSEAEAAAPKAGMNPEEPGCEVAVRYLIDQGYIEASDEASETYTITVPGIDRVKELQGSD